MQLQCSHTRPAFSCILANLFSVLSCFNSRYAYGKFYELLIYFENRRRFVQLPTIFRGLFKITLYGILEHFVLYCLLLSQKVNCEKKKWFYKIYDIVYWRYNFLFIFYYFFSTEDNPVKVYGQAKVDINVALGYFNKVSIHF